MNCLPIAVRELRVAARKRSSFWLRVVAAITGVIIGTACFVLSDLKGIRPADIGSTLFHVLAWMSLAAALLAGPFFTSDCLSEEKREGTLGLLFLTELRGYDVAIGKLLSTSLRSYFALLAVVPILGVTVLMGGITGPQYWKSALALVSALFLSLSAGLFISALSRDSQKALTATLLLLLLLAFGTWLADVLMADLKRSRFQPILSLANPGYLLVAASGGARAAYWPALLTIHGLSWAMFVTACAVVPRAWQERKRVRAETGRSWSYALRHGRTKWRARMRRVLLERQPITWLACRDRWQTRALWTMALLAAGGFIAVVFSKAPQEVWMIWMYAGGLFTLLLYMWAASQACRFLGEARRSNFLELLLVTPVEERRIVRGQWLAFLRMFGLPVLLLLGVHVAGATLAQLAFQSVATQAAAAMPAATPVSPTNQMAVVASNQTLIVGGPRPVTFSTSTTMRTNPAGATVTTTAAVSVSASPGGAISRGSAQEVARAAGAAAAAAIATIANLLAVCWFGMWMGVTSKSANLAALKTILFVQIIPWLVISFGTSIVMGVVLAGAFNRGRTTPSAEWLVWWPLLSAVLGAVLAVGKDLAFIFWSRGKLYSGLRIEAGRNLGQPRFRAAMPTPVAPPRIPA